MTPRQSIKLENEVKEVLDDQWLEATAREVGAVQRRGKISIAAFVCTLILGFGAARERTIASLRRAFQNATGVSVAPSAFYDRFTDGLVQLMRQAVARAVERAAEPTHALAGVLTSFRDLVITDASVIRLRDLLAPNFPACRTNHTQAAAKLHVVLSVMGGGPRSIKLTSERTHDKQVFRIGPWVKGRLLLFDLGYYCFQLFDRINRNGGYFISRIKKNANPLIVATNLAWRGKAVKVVGQRLQDVLPRLKRRTLDVIIEVVVTRRAYRGVQSQVTRRFRLVGIYNEEGRCYHLYITNIPAGRLAADEVAQVYRARWEVELLFKELKSFYGLEDIPSANMAVVEALILAAVLAAIVSRTLLAAIRRHLAAHQRRLPNRRFAAIFATLARQILIALMATGSAAKHCWERITVTLLAEVVDPNVSRCLNLETVGVPL